MNMPNNCIIALWRRSQKSTSWTEPGRFVARCQAKIVGMKPRRVVANTTAIVVALRLSRLLIFVVQVVSWRLCLHSAYLVGKRRIQDHVSFGCWKASYMLDTLPCHYYSSGHCYKHLQIRQGYEACFIFQTRYIQDFAGRAHLQGLPTSLRCWNECPI